MNGFSPHRCRRRAWLVAAAMLGVAALPARDGDLPDAAQIIAQAGRRLSRNRSVGELTTLARDGDRLLACLTPSECAALAQGGTTFRVDRPVMVEVAAPVQAVPFWLLDAAGGFCRLDRPLRVSGADWALFRKRFPAGWVRLGVNGLDRRPKAHYAVFVRPAGRGALPAVEGLDRARWRIAPAREGISAASDLELPIGPLPEHLRGSLLLQPAHGRRHEILLARGRVWKTHDAAGAEPDQVCVAFGDEPARSLVWTWRTDPHPTATRLRLAPAGPGGRGPARADSIRTIDGDSELIETPDLLNDPRIRRHRVAVRGLTPDTAYAYSLGSGRDGRWSWTPWKTVRTGPARPRSFRFLYMGDPQCGLEEWGRLLASARRRHPQAAFLLIAGDLVDRGNERTNWDHFFLRAAGVFDELPLMPAAGNHEYLDQGPRLYRAFFELPRNGPGGIESDLVYSFECGNVFVAVLDSTRAVADPASAQLQARWLDEALGRSRAHWKLVMFHHPLYASHPTRENPALRAAWEPVLDAHQVDLVLQGHDHAYLRTYALRGGQRPGPGEVGTTYIVSVSGTKYCEQRQRPETAVGITGLSTYQTIDVLVPENRLIYRAWDVEGREVDSLTLDKPSDPAPASAPARVAARPT